jgi:hypothetical protein
MNDEKISLHQVGGSFPPVPTAGEAGREFLLMGYFYYPY